PVDFAAAAAPGAFLTSHWRAFLSLGVLCVVLLHSGGRYKGRLHLSTLDDIPMIIGRAFVGVAIIATISALRHPKHDDVTEFLRWSALAAVLLIVGRGLSHVIILAARKHGLI